MAHAENKQHPRVAHLLDIVDSIQVHTPHKAGGGAPIEVADVTLSQGGEVVGEALIEVNVVFPAKKEKKEVDGRQVFVPLHNGKVVIQAATQNEAKELNEIGQFGEALVNKLTKTIHGMQQNIRTWQTDRRAREGTLTEDDIRSRISFMNPSFSKDGSKEYAPIVKFTLDCNTTTLDYNSNNSCKGKPKPVPADGMLADDTGPFEGMHQSWKEDPVVAQTGARLLGRGVQFFGKWELTGIWFNSKECGPMLRILPQTDADDGIRVPSNMCIMSTSNGSVGSTPSTGLTFQGYGEEGEEGDKRSADEIGGYNDDGSFKRPRVDEEGGNGDIPVA